MTITVPAGEKTGAFAIQAHITALAARTDTFSAQLKAQREAELVHALLDQQRLNAAAILSTVPFTGKNPQAAAITAAQGLITSYGASMPGAAETATLDQLQRQAVADLLATGQMTGAAVLASSLMYAGGAHS